MRVARGPRKIDTNHHARPERPLLCARPELIRVSVPHPTAYSFVCNRLSPRHWFLSGSYRRRCWGSRRKRSGRPRAPRSSPAERARPNWTTSNSPDRQGLRPVRQGGGAHRRVPPHLLRCRSTSDLALAGIGQHEGLDRGRGKIGVAVRHGPTDGRGGRASGHGLPVDQ